MIFVITSSCPTGKNNNTRTNSSSTTTSISTSLDTSGGGRGELGFLSLVIYEEADSNHLLLAADCVWLLIVVVRNFVPD
jgi:hypothetical protein